MRGDRRTAGAVLPREVQRHRVAVEVRAGRGGEATAAGVIAADIQGEDFLVEAHEHRARRGEHVRVAQARAVRVVRRIRLEDSERRLLAELRQVTAELVPGRDGCRGGARSSDERDRQRDQG